MKSIKTIIWIKLMLNFLCIAIWLNGISQNKTETDSLRQLIKQTPASLARLELLIELAEIVPDAHESLEFSEEAINLADSLNQKPQLGKALQLNATAWKKWGDPVHAIEQLNKAADIFSDLHLDKELSWCYLELGEAYRATGNYSTACTVLYKALPLVINQNDNKGLAYGYNRLAAIYFEIFVNNPVLRKIFDEEQITPDTLAFLRSNYPVLKNTEDSLNITLRLSDSIATLYHISDIVISGKNIEAAYYHTINEMTEALGIYHELIQIIGEENYHPDLPLILINTGWLYRRLSQIDQAIKYGEKALELSSQYSVITYIRMANELLHGLYTEKGDYEKAYHSLFAYTETMHKMYNADMELKIRKILVEQKATQNELLLQQRKKHFNQIITVSILIIFLLVFFSLILIAQIRKQRKLLKKLNEQNIIISAQNQELALTNAEKDKFFSIIAHDLKSPFTAMIGFSELLIEEIKEKNYDILGEYADMVHKSSNQAFNLLTNLLEWSRSKTGRIKFSPETFSLGELAAETIALANHSAIQKEITIENHVTENIEVFADRAMIHTVLRNLLSNAVKFTCKGGRVILSAITENNQITVKVSDNGVGMSKQQLSGLFNISQSQSQPGTMNEKGTGLGLILTKEFIEKHHGSIQVESEPDHGTTFTFTLSANTEKESLKQKQSYSL
ncbi:MAG: sensor histidine kinase [Sphingobacteriia bacterium]|nr:sensor histidine kinase [Sphingobacteriia bacterium]